MCYGLGYATPILNVPKDPAATAEMCRQVAIKMDWLSRYQDYPTCTRNLDGLNVYIASRYISNQQYAEAKTLLTTASYQVNFALNIHCYGQEDIKAVLLLLNGIIETL
jgi:hypothetical protein